MRRGGDCKRQGKYRLGGADQRVVRQLVSAWLVLPPIMNTVQHLIRRAYGLLSVSRWVDCRTSAKIYEAIGRLKERYPRVARYYELAYDEQQGQLSCLEDLQRKQKAESLDGSYLLKSSRNDLGAEDIWRT